MSNRINDEVSGTFLMILAIIFVFVLIVVATR